MKKVLCILSVLILLTSCKFSKEKSKIVVAKNLIGIWESQANDGKLLEIWKKVNDSVYNGQSYFILAKDTLHSEKMQLKQNGENLYYISTIKGQNNDQAVTFKLIDSVQKQLIFENAKNDYPKKIVYKQISNDDLIIEISGNQQGKPSSDKYSMKRMK